MRRQEIAHSWAHGERGVVLILSYLAVAVFLTLQATYLSRVVADNQFVQRYQYRAQALHLGEAGVDEAIGHLRYLASYIGTPTTALGAGSFTTTVAPTGHIDNTGLFPKTELRMQSAGRYPTTSIGPEARQLTDVVSQEPRPFTYGLFAATPIAVNGTLTVRCTDARQPQPCSQSRMGTNATGPQSIDVVGSINTNGAVAACGAGCNPATDIHVVGFENITRAALEERKAFPIPNLPGIPNEGFLTVLPGQTRTLTPGTHLFSGLNLGANATLTAGGPVTVHISTGVLPQFGPNSKILASTLVPSDFVMIMQVATGVTAIIPLPNVTFTAAMYLIGDNFATLQFTNGTVTGSFITSLPVQILGATTFTYDVALSNVPVGSDAIPWEFNITQRGWVNDH